MFEWINNLFKFEKGGIVKTVTLKRTQHLENATIGKLTISGVKTDLIHTLENPDRSIDENGDGKKDIIINKDSRIPAGTYTCKPFSGSKYKDVYEVTGVKDRSAILIHWGNFERDTLGCILIGNRFTLKPEPAVLESKRCFERFRSLIGKQEFALVIED